MSDEQPPQSPQPQSPQPQSPQPQSPQPAGASHPTPGGSAPRSRRGVVLAGVVALVVVVGVVGFLVGRALGGGESPDRAESNARAACVILERTDADDPLPQDGLDDPTFWELSAVPGLTGAAAAGDDEYDDLDEQGQVVGTAVQTLSRERLGEAVRAATEECDSLGLD